MLKICALSDQHGALPEIGPCDVVFICGDTFPLEVQRNAEKSQKWFLNQFCEWVKNLPCKRVYMIAGNHCFWIEKLGYDEFTRLIEEKSGLHGKLVYVEDGLIEIEKGLTLYGTPWCTGPKGWAYIDYSGNKYEDIPDCDILLTHQPPQVGQLGCSYPNTLREEDWGSFLLKEVIKKRRIRYNFCGHIHTGVHGGVKLLNCETEFYNVSIKDEDYKVAFEPTYLEITT